ncbi:CPN21 [Symbiodinium natans]|uniref:CPN21 protein n=1 Tax=Symbiodinium natans TaxID=878477 RepID=A0A812I020_9DINO|nr:CPN21 [Symbiodinium natans]
MDVFGIDVECAKISGEVLTLSVNSDSLVRDLKRAISNLATPSEPQFHPICQQIMWQGRALEDTEILQKLCEPPRAGDKAKLDVTLLLTVDGILSTFGLGRCDLAVAAINAARTQAVCDEQVLSALYHCTRWGLFSRCHSPESISQPRVKAAESINAFAQKGQENAVDALIRCLKSPSREVREIAIDGLLLAPMDKELLCKKLRKHIDGLLSVEDNDDEELRRVKWQAYEGWDILPALEMLGLLSHPSDEDSLRVLKKALDIKYDFVGRQIFARRVTLSSLGHVGWTCPKTSCKLVRYFVKFCSVLMSPVVMGRFGLVNDPHDHWETTVPVVAQQMCSFGDTRLVLPEQIVDELVSLLSHAGQTDPRFRHGTHPPKTPSAASARRAATELLSACGNETVVEKTLPLLKHHWDEVKIAAMTVLGRRALEDEALIAELTSFIHSGSSAVAQTAVTALGQVGKGNEQAIATLRSCLSHADGWVRRSTPAALLCAAGPSAVAELQRLCAQGDVEVAEASLRALSPEHARAAAAQALNHQEPYIQVVAGNQLLKLHRISDLLFDVSSGHLRCLDNFVYFMREGQKDEPEAPSTEVFVAVADVVRRREISETKRICISFLYALGIWLQHTEAINLLQELVEEKLWHPLPVAQEAVRLLREKPKPKMRKMMKVKWTSSMLTLDRDDDLPAPSADDEDLQQFWHAYYVDGFSAHVNQTDALESGPDGAS